MAGTGNNDKMTGWAGVLMPCVDTQVRACGEQQEARRGLPLPMRADGLPDGGGKDGAAGCALAPVADESQAVGAMLPAAPGRTVPACAGRGLAHAVRAPGQRVRAAGRRSPTSASPCCSALQEGTVNEHVSAILAKHCVRDRRQLIRQRRCCRLPAGCAGAMGPVTSNAAAHAVRRRPAPTDHAGGAGSHPPSGRRAAIAARRSLESRHRQAAWLCAKTPSREHVSAILMALKTPRRAQVMALMRQFELHLCPES